ncbi:MAG: hypothetical protein AAGC97_18965, partial [Planctomycetota bacterium]
MRRTAARDFDVETKLGLAGRSEDERTRSRRAGRSRRRRTIAAVALLFGLLLLLGGPSLLCRLPWTRSMVRQTVQRYGWDVQSELIDIGWITPLSLRGVRAEGLTAGSTIEIDECQTTLTLLDAWAGKPQSGQFGQVTLRGVRISGHVDHQWSSIEDDLADLIRTDPSKPTANPVGTITFQDVQMELTDAPTSASWKLTQSHGEAVFDGESVRAGIAGVVTQPNGADGSVQADIATGDDPGSTLRLNMAADSLPLSILDLLLRRFPDSDLPARIHGDVTGGIVATLAIPADISAEPSSTPVSVAMSDVQVRNLVAVDASQGQVLWQNQLAVISGEVHRHNGHFTTRDLVAQTDFGQVALNGNFPQSISTSGGPSNPFAWLDRVDATATLELDLPRFVAAFPQALPIKDDADLRGGRVQAWIETLHDRPGNPVGRRRRLTVRTGVIDAESPGGPIRVAPMDLVAVVYGQNGQLAAEKFQLESPFATVDGRGDLESGQARLQFDFGKLARIIQPLLKSSLELDGLVDGSIDWEAQENGVWRLRGDGNATELVMITPAGEELRQDSVRGEVDLVGRWQSSATVSGAGYLRELSQGRMNLWGDGINTTIDLVQAIDQLDRHRQLPLRMRTQGKWDAVAIALGPWLPAPLAAARGSFDLVARGSVAGDGTGLLTSLDGTLNAVSIPIESSAYFQNQIKLHFDGNATLPVGDCIVRSMTVTGDAASAAFQGQYIDGVADMEIALRGDLQKLQNAGAPRLAQRRPASTRPAAARSENQLTGLSSSWLVAGIVDGNVVVTGDRSTLHLDLDLAGDQLGLRERALSASRSSPVSSRLVWSEPKIQITGSAQWNVDRSSIETTGVDVVSDWFAARLAGVIEQSTDVHSMRLSGPAQFKMDVAAERLSVLTGMQMVAEGVHQTPLTIQIASGHGDSAFTIDGSLGWESADAAGMLFGPASIPFTMTESTIDIAAARIPVMGASRMASRMIGPQVAPLSYDPSRGDQWRRENELTTGDYGEITVTGQVRYRPELLVQLQPGPIARNVRLTPEMTENWLKYLAPIAADAARLEGSFGAELDEALIDLDRPERSRVRGRLNVRQVV